tara:strand:+ start:495 stop:698 length:204 start_codon:yes stop_codon:yes gene_type:complete
MPEETTAGSQAKALRETREALVKTIEPLKAALAPYEKVAPNLFPAKVCDLGVSDLLIYSQQILRVID